MATLWICEKYSVASELARVLFGGIAAHNPPVIVATDATRLIYTNGHALQPAAPELYDPAYKSWDHQDLTSLVQNGFRLVESPGKSGIVSVIDKELQTASNIVVATDAGREGEMIAWELIERVGAKAPIRRFWTSALTENALRKAAAMLLPAEQRLPLYHAAWARTRADWIEGLTYTRYFTRRHGAPHARPLSIGRVQTALAGIIDDRCREIRDFVPQIFFEVEARIEMSHGQLTLRHRPPADHRITDHAQAEAIAAVLQGQSASLQAETAPRSVQPPNFLSTSGVQKRAFALWNWAPDHSLDLLQNLYEAKLITYPRTECTYLSADHATQMPHMLAKLSALPEVAAIAEANPEWFDHPIIRAACFDDAKLTDHHAIIPTENIPDLARLPANEAELYGLVVRHTVANLLPDFAYDSIGITAEIGGKAFTAHGRTIRDLGWRTMMADHQDDGDIKRARKRSKTGAASLEIEDVEDEEFVDLPSIENGEQGMVGEGIVASMQTKAPPYFSQASLLDAMTNIDLYIDDPQAKTVLSGASAGQKLGIGTGATRAHIIRTIFDRGYVEERGTAIHMTARGSSLIGLARRLIPWMVDPLHSVEQEAALQDIETGKGEADAYVAEVIERTRQTLSTLQRNSDATRIEDMQATDKEETGMHRSEISRDKGRSFPHAPSTRKKASEARVYFSVPYEQRHEAKSAGLRWDADVRKWYAYPEIAEQVSRNEKFGPSSAATMSTLKDRFYYDVPFDRKDQAKTIGMQFDGERKQWFAPSPEVANAASAIFSARGG